MSHFNILVVEDNLIAAKSAQILLESRGCQVDLAGNGEKAIELSKKNHYHCIYMDIGLPTISGVDVCLAIREHETKNHLDPTPIVAVTGNNGLEETKEYLTAGMQEVMDKPFTLEKVERFLSYCAETR